MLHFLLFSCAFAIIIPIKPANISTDNQCANKVKELLGDYEVEIYPGNVNWTKYDWRSPDIIQQLENDSLVIYKELNITVHYDNSDFPTLMYLQSQSSVYNPLLTLAGVNRDEASTWPESLGNYDACLAFGDDYQWCTTRNMQGLVDAAMCIPIECSGVAMSDPALLATILASFAENLYTSTLTCSNNFIDAANVIATIDFKHFNPETDLPKFFVLNECFMQQRAIDYLNTFSNLAAYSLATQGAGISCANKQEQRETRSVDTGAGVVMMVFAMLILLSIIATSFYAFRVLQIQLARDEKVRQEETQEYGMLSEEPAGEDNRGSASGSIVQDKEPFERKPWERFLLYWSLQDSLYECFYPGKQVAFPALDGIRAIAMLQVMLGHSAPFIIQIYNYSNPNDVMGPHGEIANFFGQAFPACYLAVDTFFWLSGFLAMYICIKKLAPAKNVVASGTKHLTMAGVKIPFIYLNRWLRLLIPVFFVMLFKSFVVPLWLITVPKNSDMYHILFDNCRGNLFFYNMFFIMNDLHKKGESCLGVTWYLQVDLRIFLFVPIAALIYIYVSKRVAFGAVVSALLAHLIAIGVWFSNNPDASSLDNDPGHGAYSKSIYFTTWGRYGPVCVGVMFAMAWDWYLKTFKKVASDKQVAIIISSSVLCLYLAYGTYGSYDMPPCAPGVTDNTDCGSGWSYASRAIWGTTHRVLWSIALTGVAFLCFKDQFPGVNFILSHEFWKPLARLSFMMYLIHLDVIIITHLLNSPIRLRYSRLWFTLYYIGLVFTTALSALLFFVLVEKPFGKMIKLFIGSLQKVLSGRSKRSEALATNDGLASGIQASGNAIQPVAKPRSFVDVVNASLRGEGEKSNTVKEDSLGHTYA